MSKFKVSRTIGGQRKYRSWKQWEEGDYIICRVLSEYQDDYGHTGYEVSVLEAEFASPEYELKDGTGTINTGDVMGINHAGSLAYKMTALGKELGTSKKDVNGNVIMSGEGLPVYEIPRNTLVMMTYQGQEKLTKGKFKNKMCHTVDVALVEEQEEQADI